MPRWIYNRPPEKCQHTKILCGQNKLLPIGKSCQKPKDHPGLSHFLMKPGCEKLPEHSNIFMSSDDTKSIELAKLAVSLLPHLETNAPLPERLKEAAQTAAVLLQYTQRALDHTSGRRKTRSCRRLKKFMVVHGTKSRTFQNLSAKKSKPLRSAFGTQLADERRFQRKNFLKKCFYLDAG